MKLAKTTIASNLLLLFGSTSSEPISNWQSLETNLLRLEDTNWTTQAFQTHCNNIDYTYLSECCTAKSGSGWHSCNNIGSHNCCNDNSVCDTGLGCCGDSCCQNSASVTVCEDGCVSKNGLGCFVQDNGGGGTCAHGHPVQVSSSSTSGGVNSTPSATNVGTSSTTISEPPGTTSSAPKTDSPSKLSSGGVIGIAVSAGCSVIALIFGIGFKIYKWKKLRAEKARKMFEATQYQGGVEPKLRTNSFPSAPISPAPQYPPYANPIDRGFSPGSGFSSNSQYYRR